MQREASLAEKGKKEFVVISRTLPYSSQVEAKSLGLGKFAWWIMVRDNDNKVRSGIEQRDASIRVGAGGALTVIYSSGKFMVPSVDKKSANCECHGPSEPWTTIRSEGKPRNGDVVIVSWADSLLLAEGGALSAALTILSILHRQNIREIEPISFHYGSYLHVYLGLKYWSVIHERVKLPVFTAWINFLWQLRQKFTVIFSPAELASNFSGVHATRDSFEAFLDEIVREFLGISSPYGKLASHS